MDGGVLEGLGGASVVAGVVAILVGLGICFWGYRLIRVVLAIFGFAVGAILGFALANLAGTSTEVALIAALAGGLIGAALSAAVYKFGIFLLGASAGAVLGGMLGANLGGNGQVIAAVVAAVLVGVLAVVAQRVVIILVTAFSGSWLAARAGTALLVAQAVDWGDLLGSPSVAPAAGTAVNLYLVVWALLGVAGAVVQLRAKKK